MLACCLIFPTAGSHALAAIFDNDLQTGVLITIGSLLLLVGTVIRYKLPSKEQNTVLNPYAFWAKPVTETTYRSSIGGSAETTSFGFATGFDRENERRPVAHLAVHSAATTQRRANVV